MDLHLQRVNSGPHTGHNRCKCSYKGVWPALWQRLVQGPWMCIKP